MATEIIEDPITKITRIIDRPDGAQAKIVAQVMTGLGLTQSTQVSVFKRSSKTDDWILCNDNPQPGFKAMSRQDYEAHGRSEALRAVSTAEILKTSSLLGQSLKACLERGTVIQSDQIQAQGAHQDQTKQADQNFNQNTDEPLEDSPAEQTDQEGLSPAP